MDEAKRRRLEGAGYRVGAADELLGLTAEESALIEMKLALRRAVRTRRGKRGITQEQLADRLGSSQSRVAKLEGVDAAVSLDLLAFGRRSTRTAAAHLEELERKGALAVRAGVARGIRVLDPFA